MKNFLHKLINRETVLYLLFGIGTTAVDYVTYCLLRLTGVNYIISNCIAWCFAVIFAFFTNKFFVFRSKRTDKNALFQEITSFFSARVFSLFFSTVFMFLSVSLLGINDLIAKIVSSIFVVVLNYFFSKVFIFNPKREEHKDQTSFFKSNLLYILAFLIPVIAMVLLYFIRDIYPFGIQTYLRSDCYHQYAPFTKELWRKITSGEGLSYSWNIGLGVNFTALYAYYLASPFNWLIGLISKAHIIEMMNLFIIIKTGLCGLTFCYYLSKKFHMKKLSMASFSIFYALSSYVCAFSWNLMWLDCLFLFPLIILGIERLVKEKKYYLYCISLGLCIISNYYIAIMICIFSVLYFAVFTFIHSNHTLRYYVEKIVNFGVYSLLAGGFAAFLFIPAFFALSQTASGDFNFPESLERYFSILEMLSRSLMNVSPAIFEPHDPNIYCTIAVFILVPLYWTNPKIEIREKVGKTLLLGVLLISFNLNIPNYIWHGFHFPNSLPCRESFIYIFLILSMSYEGFLHIKEVSNKQLYGAFGCSVGIFLVLEQLFVDDSYSYKTIYLSILFLALYLLVFSMFRSKYAYRHTLSVYLLFVLTFSETFVNMGTAFSTTSRTAYLKDNDNIDSILEQVNREDSGFFRMEKYDRRTKNDAAWHGYRGASLFSSTTIAGISDLYGMLGLEESCNAYAYYGHTPLTEALLSVKYVFSNETREDSNLSSLYTSSLDSDSNIYLYRNNYVLPLGFMVDSNLSAQLNTVSSNPFSVQNSLALALGSEGDLFNRLEVTTVNDINQIYADSTMHLYIYSATSCDNIDVEISNEGVAVSGENYDSMKHKHIIDVGTVESGSTVSVSSGDSEVSSIQIYAYSFNEELFTSLIDRLNQNGMEITDFSDTNVKGTVTAKEDGLLFTSISYDKGWSVYVDGKKVTPEALEDALLMIPVTSGTHEIELKYTTPGLYLGMILSILSVLAFIIIVICNKKLSLKKPVTEKAEIEEN